jgi:hypothetical protein
MFKKTLLAVSVLTASAAASAGTAMTWTDGKGLDGSVASPTISTQGYEAVKATTNYFSPAAIVYKVSSAANLDIDHIQIELTGADFKDTTAVFQVVSGTDGTTVAQSLTGEYTFGDTNSVKVTGFPAGGVSDGYFIQMKDAKIIPAEFTTDSSSSLAMTLNSSLTAIDTATATLATFIDQFSLSVTDTFGKAGEKIDVQADAKALANYASDAFTIAVESTTPTYVPYSAATSVAGALTGDFAWALDADGSVSAGLTLDAEYTITSAAQKLEAVFDTTTSVSDAYSVTAQPSKADGTGSLSTGAYSANVGVYDPTGAVTLLAPSKLELGSWELNGSDVAIPYMPFGPNFASAISVTNTGSFEGDIMVSFTANGKTTDLETIGSSTAKSVVNIGAAVSALAITKGLSQAQVNIVVKAPQNDIKVTAIYYVKGDQDRVKVN